MATTRKTQTAANISDATVINSAIPHAEETIHAAEIPEQDAEFFKNMFKMISGELTWKRVIIAWVVGLATLAGLSYLGTAIVTYLTIGAALFSASSLIMQILYVLGLIITAYAAYRASVFAHLAIVDKKVDAVCSSAWGWTKNLFSSEKAVPQAS